MKVVDRVLEPLWHCSFDLLALRYWQGMVDQRSIFFVACLHTLLCKSLSDHENLFCSIVLTQRGLNFPLDLTGALSQGTVQWGMADFRGIPKEVLASCTWKKKQNMRVKTDEWKHKAAEDLTHMWAYVGTCLQLSCVWNTIYSRAEYISSNRIGCAKLTWAKILIFKDSQIKTVLYL